MTTLRELKDRRILALLLLVAASAVVALIGGRLFLQAMFEGRSLDILNRVISSRSPRPLDAYFEALHVLIFVGHFLVLAAGTLTLTWRQHSPKLFLIILLATDLVLAYVSESYGGIYDVRYDWSVPEFFQYAKEMLIAGLFFRLFRSNGQRLYAVLSGLFLFLLADDALRYHERFGHWVEEIPVLVSLSERVTVRPNDLGELLSFVVPGAVFGPLIIVGFLRADASMRFAAVQLGLLMAALAFFGLAVDLLDRLESLRPWMYVIGFIEDFGEMVCMTLLAVFTARVAWRSVPAS